MPTVDQLLKEANNTDDDDVALAKNLAALELDDNDSRIHYNGWRVGLERQALSS